LTVAVGAITPTCNILLSSLPDRERHDIYYKQVFSLIVRIAKTKWQEVVSDDCTLVERLDID
jgi:hypothetical protein